MESSSAAPDLALFASALEVDAPLVLALTAHPLLFGLPNALRFVALALFGLGGPLLGLGRLALGLGRAGLVAVELGSATWTTA